MTDSNSYNDFNNYYNLIGNYKKGYKNELYLGHKKLNSVLNGIQMGKHYCLLGETGTAKSLFCIDTFIMGLYNTVKNYNIKYKTEERKIKFKIIYFAIKDKKLEIINKLIAWRLRKDLGVVIDYNYLLSRNNNKLSNNLYKFIKLYETYFSKLLEKLVIINGQQTPSSIERVLNNVKQDVEPYTKVVVIVDDVNCLIPEPGTTEFTMHANHSSNSSLIYAKKFNFAIINVINTKSPEKLYIKSNPDLLPTLGDLEPTCKPYGKSCDIALSIFKPYTYVKSNPLMVNYAQQHITVLKDRMRSIAILKNNNGISSGKIPYYFIGESCYFSELPTSKKKNNEDTDYVMSIVEAKEKENVAVLRHDISDKNKTIINNLIKEKLDAAEGKNQSNEKES